MFKFEPRALMITSIFCASVAYAQHSSDIILTVRAGEIVTNGSTAGVEIEQRVFLSRLGEVAPNFSDSPGFDCLPGTFPVGSRNGFRVLGGLRIWNATSFDSILPRGMNIAFATLQVDTPVQSEVAEGFSLSVGSNGQWHRHFDYVLAEGAGDGFYLLTLELYSTNTQIGASEPVFIIFNQNMPYEQEQHVIDYVLSTLAPACPADFNDDGGVDGADIGAFFDAWSGSDVSADINIDGGVDGADVEEFFTVWSNGGCE